ncbi:hypothetical protein [Marinoscillum sp. MHG1-6]|uniref:hypothetical protein n=1 Tax=Marinoscillum sp. MHG1-6 TaxID=2959627 RepID=UPI002157B969|nr:hypothetical protein [Marinoscillum sp. MHG1-6]
MAGLAFSSLRVGHRYWLRNFGDLYEFQITEYLGSDDFYLKDLNTLEYYQLSELIKYGRGRDFELRELR